MGEMISHGRDLLWGGTVRCIYSVPQSWGSTKGRWAAKGRGLVGVIGEMGKPGFCL